MRSGRKTIRHCGSSRLSSPAISVASFTGPPRTVLRSLFAETRSEIRYVFRFVAQAAAVEPYRQVLHGGLWKHFQNFGQTGRRLTGAQRLVDKFRYALLDPHLGE
ncbi:MAG: hypothetical protein DMG39_10980 [Acidobacteria bacterium]|nr:MAG: hypothetical protein DMG39_10980 [Acidobacteriota bacterium]